MRALEYGARQLALMGRGPKQRRKRPVVPKARPASAPRVAYLHGILRMVDAMHARVRRDLLPALRPIIAEHNARRPDAMQMRIDATGSRTAEEIKRIRDDLEREIPERSIALLAEANALRVAEHSRRELDRQVRAVVNIDVHADPTVLAEHIEAFVEDNVRLVKSLLTDELEDLKGIVLRGARAGLRYEEIAEEIAEKFGATKRRAALIASDQVSSLNAELTRIRQQQVGIEQYTWSTVKDQRVRKSHRVMEGSSQRWDHPPTVDGVPAHPGQPINCRCQAIPDVDAALREAGLLTGTTDPPPPPSTPPRRPSLVPPPVPAQRRKKRRAVTSSG
jgi:SPP1 gp7 family putative phage head morphogenesis protein